MVEADKDNVFEVAIAGLNDRRSTIYKNPNVNYYPPKEIAEKNIGGSIILEFLGGDFNVLPHIELTPNEFIGEPMNIVTWRESVNESNFVLTSLSGEDIIPIYNLIADPIKKQQVKKAVIAHIQSKQLDLIETVPIFQMLNGKQHRYFTSYKDFKNSSDASIVIDGAIGSLFVKEIPGTVPLNLFSNRKNERLSLNKDITDGKDMHFKEIAGYVYEIWQNNLNTVYEISNGDSFAYTTESKETYGEKGTWKKTGNEFYSKKISL